MVLSHGTGVRIPVPVPTFAHDSREGCPPKLAVNSERAKVGCHCVRSELRLASHPSITTQPRSVHRISLRVSSRFEFGIVVTNDRRVYQFGFNYLDKPVEQGDFTEWLDLTERHASSPYREEVAAALDLQAES